MNAQQIIDESNTSEFLSLFYPEIYRHEEADLNLTKCLRRLK